MKVALYFGSFNPIHNAHTQLATYLLDQKYADEVWFVVSPSNPLKNPESLIDEYLRLDMVMLAIRNIAGCKASDIEFTMPVPSFTVDTLSCLSEEYPDCEFSLVIGCDNAVHFSEWKGYQTILEHYEIMVYPRNGFDFSSVKKLYPKMKLLASPLYDISSTQIRNLLAQKKDVSSWLHPDVYDFISDNQLYQR